MRHHIGADTISPGTELFDGGGTVGVAGGAQHRVAFLAVGVRQPTDGRGLTAAVDAHDQHHRRSFRSGAVLRFVQAPQPSQRLLRRRQQQRDELVAQQPAHLVDGARLRLPHALQHAHQRDFVHRDIKPKNIMITRHGVVKLADLGLARAMSDKEAAEAEAGRAYGTP